MKPGEGDLEVAVAGEKLLLLPERAAFWPANEILLVADPHFGKAAAFRAGGIPVPAGTTGGTLQRLSDAVSRMEAKRVIFLGDLLHAKQGRSKGMFDALAAWTAKHPEVALTLVRGNHDKHAGDPPAELAIRCVDSLMKIAPFVLAHHPVKSEDGYVLAGHVHPCVRLYGAGRYRLRLPCFVFGPSVGIFPAFGDFTGFADEDPDPSAAVYAVAEGSVIAV
jgi:DNA ligase-associated metallophosphoesterase